MSEFRLVGKVKEAHGLHGELYILIFSGEAQWLSDLNEIRISFNEGASYEVYPIKKARPHKKGFIVKCDGISDRNMAEAKKGALFYIPSEILVSKPGENIYLAEIEGFEVIDEQSGEIGRIVGFSSNGAQDLILVRDGERPEIEIPLVESFIERIAFDEQKLFLKLPEGMIEE